MRPGRSRVRATALAYGRPVIDDAELAAAVAERAHWRLDGLGAVYAPPDASAEVRVRAVRTPARRERYVAAIVQGGTAAYAVPWPTAVAAVLWAERARLS